MNDSKSRALWIAGGVGLAVLAFVGLATVSEKEAKASSSNGGGRRWVRMSPTSAFVPGRTYRWSRTESGPSNSLYENADFPSVILYPSKPSDWPAEDTSTGNQYIQFSVKPGVTDFTVENFANDTLVWELQ